MIMWRNTVEPNRPQTTIWRMRVACFIRKTTDIHSEYVKLNAAYGNNNCTNALHCYVIRKLRVLLTYEDVSGCCTY